MPTRRIELVRQAISVGEVEASLRGDPDLGGLAIFQGITRVERNEQYGGLVHLEYEAYEPMAIAKMTELVNHAEAHWSLGRTAIVHRLGRVPVAEVSVYIGAAAAHRAEAFEACRWLIDTLKVEVPIWKKDVFESGVTQWVDPSGGKTAGAG